MTTTPRHGLQEPGGVPWLASIATTPPQSAQSAQASQPGPAVTGPVHVFTRPSIPRIAIGVFLGLVLYTATVTIALVVLAVVLGDRLDESLLRP